MNTEEIQGGLEKVIAQCIAAGIKSGIDTAFNWREYPTEDEIFATIDEEIWIELYSQLEFDENGYLPQRSNL